MDSTQISTIVQKVMEELDRQGALPASGNGVKSATFGKDGIFPNMEDAIQAAVRAQAVLSGLSLEKRKQFIAAIRKVVEENAADISKRTIEETGMGRFEHKVQKCFLAARFTPGVEDLEQTAWTGDHGLTVVEMAPFGVIGAITPSTHPVPTLTNNAISMISAGNSVVVNPHPGAKNVSNYGVQLVNRAIVQAGGPENLITSVEQPTIETGTVLFNHPDIDLLCITGGPGVVQAAMKASKRAICAGPGNPPVVVDETADLVKAAKSIIEGATFDNNILCIGEKIIIVVDSVADELKKQLIAHGAQELSTAQMDQLAEKVFVDGGRGTEEPVVVRKFVGRDADVLAREVGVNVNTDVVMLFGETPVEHPFVLGEQMMPCLPLVRVKDVDEAIRVAIHVEHGFRHTALMHSKNVENLTKMGKAMNCCLFVKNGPSGAGLGVGGEGTITFSIASPTGEGITTARTFTRMRRCTMVDYLRIV
ncbi:aldehyde dehydrogenase EutE [candidate division KSB1 bacterium]|nr:aldehyde dehydrogenase EutE [candidate division KSB1 bacterium]